MKTLTECKTLNLISLPVSVALLIAGVKGQSDRRKRIATVISMNWTVLSKANSPATSVVANKVIYKRGKKALKYRLACCDSSLLKTIGVTMPEKKIIMPTLPATRALDKEFTTPPNLNRLPKCKNVPACVANF